MSARIGEFVPPVIAGSLVTAAATLTLLPVVLGLIEAIREAIPTSALQRPPAVSSPRREAAGASRSHRTPRLGDRKEIST